MKMHKLKLPLKSKKSQDKLQNPYCLFKNSAALFDKFKSRSKSPIPSFDPKNVNISDKQPITDYFFDPQ